MSKHNPERGIEAFERVAFHRAAACGWERWAYRSHGSNLAIRRDLMDEAISGTSDVDELLCRVSGESYRLALELRARCCECEGDRFAEELVYCRDALSERFLASWEFGIGWHLLERGEEL